MDRLQAMKTSAGVITRVETVDSASITSSAPSQMSGVRKLRRRVQQEVYEIREAWHEIWTWLKRREWRTMAKNAVNLRKTYLRWIAFLAVLSILSVVVYFKNEIFEALLRKKPAIVAARASWLAPIAILMIQSFPPLAGHEITLTMTGLIWENMGLVIAVLGTFLGEIAVFLLFRRFKNTGRKLEQRGVLLGCLARVLRYEGIVILSIVRYSFIPGHIVTALCALVGTSFWRMAVAILFSIPKALGFTGTGIAMSQFVKATVVAEMDPGSSAAAAMAKKRMIGVLAAVVVGQIVLSLLSGFFVYMCGRKYYRDVYFEHLGRKAVAAGSTSTLSDDTSSLYSSSSMRKEIDSAAEKVLYDSTVELLPEQAVVEARSEASWLPAFWPTWYRITGQATTAFAPLPLDEHEGMETNSKAVTLHQGGGEV